ncbi:MAG: V-type ATP synthase subunit F [Thermoplasmatota archaeon]
MSELAVVGSETFTLGFRLAGVRRVWNASEESELTSSVRQAMADDDVSILVMATADVDRLDARLRDELVTSVKPTLVAVGQEEDNTLRNKIKQAVGVDLW